MSVEKLSYLSSNDTWRGLERGRHACYQRKVEGSVRANAVPLYKSKVHGSY